MENRNQNILIYSLGAAVALLLLGLFLAIGSVSKSKKNIGLEKVANNKLIDEKLLLENQLAKLLSDFNALEEKSNANEKLLSDTQSKLSENEKKINSISGENRSLRADRQELADLKNAKELLNKEFEQLKSEHSSLLSRSSELQNSIKSLEDEKRDLSGRLEKSQMFNPDNFLVTATRGKKAEKIVIRASRTKKLNMTFEVPQSLTETISFKIVTPTGITINPDDKAMTWYVQPDSRNYTASLSSFTGEFEESRKVILSYSVKTKLVKGEYKIQIISKDVNIGNCRILLK